MDGRIVEVKEQSIGSALRTDLAGSETTIDISDGTPFDEEGQIIFVDADGTISSTPLTYTGLVDDDDSTAPQLTGISPPVGEAHVAEDTLVLAWPISPERWATVVMGDLEGGGDEEGLIVRVPHALYDKLPVGIRDPAAGEGESIELEFSGDELVISDITAQFPDIDGSFINVDTLPPIPVSTDGNPPISSPAAIVEPAYGGLAVSWDEIGNADPVTYDVFVATTSSPASNPTNRVGTVQGTLAFVRALSDGTPLQDNVLYYVQIQARDADGAASAGAAASDSILAGTGATDGNPPSASPSMSGNVYGSIGILVLNWDPVANVDPVAYEVHVATSGSGFTPSATTLALETEATSAVIRTMPDGTALAYGTTYYVKLMAKDDDGGGYADPTPMAGSSGSASLIKVNGGADILANSVTTNEIAAGTITATDIAAGTITANELAAGSVTAEEIAAGSVTTDALQAGAVTADKILGNTITADKLDAVFVLANLLVAGIPDSQRVEMDAAGMRLLAADDSVLVNLPTDSNLPATFAGQAILSATIVQGNLVIQGLNNLLDQGAILTLTEQQANPNHAAVVSSSYPLAVTLTNNRPASTLLQARVSHYDANGGAAGTLPVYLGLMDHKRGDNTYVTSLVEWNAATGAINRQVDLISPQTNEYYPIGAARVGTSIYVCYRSPFIGALLLQDVTQSTFVVHGNGTMPSQVNTDLGAGTGATVTFTSDGTDLYWFSKDASTSRTHKTVQTIAQYNANAGAATTTLLDAAGALWTGDAANPGGVNYSVGALFGAAWDGTNWTLNFGYSSSGLSGVLKESYVGATNVLVAKSQVFFPSTLYTSKSGIVYNGTNFLFADVGGSTLKLYQMSGFVWDYTLGNNVYAAYRWEDATHQTMLSDMGSKSMDSGISSAPLMRQTINVTVPAMPGSVTKSTIFGGLASSLPAATALRLQSYSAHVSSQTGPAITWTSWDPAGTLVTNTNTFAGGAPAQIKGTGSLITAPWIFKADGSIILPRMTVIQRPASPGKGTLAWDEDYNREINSDGIAWKPTREIRPSRETYIFDDYMGPQVPLDGSNTNGGTSPNPVTSALSNHPGAIDMDTGTTSNATGSANLNLMGVTTGNLAVFLGSGRVRAGALVRWTAITTPFFNSRFGWSDQGGNNEMTNGFMFRYNPSVNSGKIQMGIGGTYSDTGITVVANTWYMLEIIVNAAGTSADFYINDAYVGTVSGAAQTATRVALRFGIEKTTSTTTARHAQIDLYYAALDFLTSRY